MPGFSLRTTELAARNLGLVWKRDDKYVVVAAVTDSAPDPPPSRFWRWRRGFRRNCISYNSLRTAKTHRQLAVDLAVAPSPAFYEAGQNRPR
jgi:hypothetical protein